MLKVWIVGSEGQIGEAINEVLDPQNASEERLFRPQGCSSRQDSE